MNMELARSHARLHLASRRRSNMGGFEPVATVSNANQGDERPVQQFMLQSGYEVNNSDYLAQIERPGYRSTERLLLRHDSRIVAHLRCYERPTLLANENLPLVELSDWAIQPGLAPSDAESLWEIAQATARQQNVWGAISQSLPQAGEQTAGWIVIDTSPTFVLPPTQLLAQLSLSHTPRASLPVARADERAGVQIRVWRQVEQAVLRRLYRQHAAHVWGARERDDDYWRWLIARRAFDHIYVAVEGNRDTGFDDPEHAVVGYAVVRGERVVEWVGDRWQVVRSLMGRIAQEALERDAMSTRFPLPLAPDDVVRRCVDELSAAAGTPVSAPPWRAKLFHPLRFLDRLRPTLVERFKQATGKTTSELGFDVNGRRFQVAIANGQANLLPGRLGRSHVTLDCHAFLELLLGTATLSQLIESERAVASTRAALELAEALFPQVRWSVSPWDTLPTLEQ